MADISSAGAQADLTNLVDRAAKGETIRITRHGKPVAVLKPLDRQPVPIDLAVLRAVTDPMPMQPEPASTWMHHERDDARY